MNIKDIMEQLIQPKINSRRMDTAPKQHKLKSVIGQGLFSTVKADRDPHTVTKISHSKGSDLYWEYISKIVIPEQDSNPYVPRVYQHTTLDHGDNTNTPYVRMERLYGWRDIEDESMLAMFTKTFYMDENLEYAFQNGVNEELNLFIMKAIVRRLKSDMPKIRETVKDKKLVELMQKIHDLARQHKIGLDIWDQNIMFRRTPHGVQLVITDPLT